MPLKKKFSIAIMDSDYISKINSIILKYGIIDSKISSHILFNIPPIDANNISEDLTFFHISSADEKSLNMKLESLIEELDELNTNYNLRDEDNGKFLEYIKIISAIDIKFDNLDIIPKGTYKKIDDLKSMKSDFGFTKGYKPEFRPIESKPIENIEIKPETIYLLSNSKEEIEKLKECLSEKIIEINPDFLIEYREFM